MENSLQTKKSTTYLSVTPTRGRVKARIFKGIATSMVSAATKAGDFLGFIKKEVSLLLSLSLVLPWSKKVLKIGKDSCRTTEVEKDRFFPADLLLLLSSYEDVVCYVETMNLDAETNLKLKQSLDATSSINDDSNFNNFKATVKCEDPNASLYNFVGTMEFQEQQYALSPQQLLLRDSKLRNTDYIYGVVIFTGHDTKLRLH
ncbi:hypothetical protein L6452_03616 [Arctium lappa]|uniref:Uncharacterized protein n=1 Tax=Arctium lappa TaxID=4217 RepID=A0ACB9FNL9_ARCLA|nr:hypothetical protein L6452_03616 [Arctium lappa]